MASRWQTLVLVLALSSSACEMLAGIKDRKGAGGAPGYDASPHTGGTIGLDGGAVGGNRGTGGVGPDALGTGDAPATDGTTSSPLDAGNLPATGGTAGGASGNGGTMNTGGSTSLGSATGGTANLGGMTSAGGIQGSGGLITTDGATPTDVSPRTDAANSDASLGCAAVGILGTGNGLLGQYFVTPTLTGLQLSRIDPSVDFNWSSAPDLGIPASAFSVRWTGQVQPRFSGHYTFYTNSDDGIRLWVDGKLIVDNWTAHEATQNSGAADLAAGQMYDIKVEYYQNSGVAVVQLSWASECQTREVIPPSQLYAPPAVCPDPSIGTGTGLKGDYFDNQDLTSLRITRTDARVSFVWPEGTSPDATVAPSTYSVRWTGQVQAEYSGFTTFYVVSDDGARVYIDDVLVIDNWTAHTRTEDVATLSTVAGQKYSLRIEYFESSQGGQIQLLWAGACQTKDVVPQTQLYPTYMGMDCSDPSVGSGIGLRGDYYDNEDFTNLVLTHNAEAVNFDWGAGSPNPAVGVDTFSVRWTGQVQAQYTGATSFHTWSDDGARLWVDGTLIIDDWAVHQAKEDVGTVNLSAGQLYDVRLDYHESDGDAVIQLSWSGPCQATEIVPATQLFPPGYVGIDAGISGDASAPPLEVSADVL